VLSATFRTVGLQGPILDHPNKVIKIKNDATARMGYSVIDIRLPDGRGARFTKDGNKFITFLEPRK